MAEDTIESLRARCAELELDAARYRWLHGRDFWHFAIPPNVKVAFCWSAARGVTKAQVDEKIDAEMASISTCSLG